MAIQAITVVFSGVSTMTFTFPTPAGNYGKTLGLTISSPTPVVPVVAVFAPDVASLGTTTGTINLSDTITGNAEIIVYDRP